MSVDNKTKNNMRRVIRILMIVLAVCLLLCALALPIANNAIALGIEKDLRALPLPEGTELVESTSAAGNLTGNGNGMQYFGAILLKSDRPLAELRDHYAREKQDTFSCIVMPQTERRVAAVENRELCFFAAPTEEGYYIVYTFGSAPAALWDLLDLDLRGH